MIQFHTGIVVSVPRRKNLEPVLGDIQANSANLLHVGDLLSLPVVIDKHLGTTMPQEGPSTPSNQELSIWNGSAYDRSDLEFVFEVVLQKLLILAHFGRFQIFLDPGDFAVALLLAGSHLIPAGNVLLAERPGDPHFTGVEVDADVVRMRDRIGRFDAKPPAALDLALPVTFELRRDCRRLQTLRGWSYGQETNRDAVFN